MIYDDFHNVNDLDHLTPQIDSLCGYYVEWGGMPGDPDVTTALTETVNIAAHRRQCRID